MSTALKIVQTFYPDVTTVKDAGRPIKIEVTKQDCRSKAVKNHKECALAVACRRTLDLDGVVIAVRVAYLVKGRVATRCGLGEAIAREITAFDRNGSFVPGAYRLVPPTHRIGDPASSGSRNASKKGKRKIQYRHITQQIRTLQHFTAGAD